MDLSKKLQNLDELESEFSEQLNLRDLYDFTNLDENEMCEVTPLLSSLRIDRQRYGEVLSSVSGGEKRIDRVYDFCAGREVALASSLKEDNQIDYEDFLREARITARLQHPNIMSIHDIGLNDQGQPFFTMDYISGQSLGQLIKNQALNKSPKVSLNELLDIFIKVCDAMAYAHSRDVIHLDLKPDNINVGDFGEVILYDWGLAKIVNTKPPPTNAHQEIEDLEILNDLTLSGLIKGTPGYLAPEQIGDDCEKSTLTDVYALGAILYTILSTKAPVNAHNFEELICKTKQGLIIPPEQMSPDRNIPASLSAVAMKALSLEMSHRYQSVDELREEIVKFKDGYATEAQHASTWVQIQLLLKRHQKTVSLSFIFLCLLFVFAIYSFMRISSEKNQALLTQHKAEENFRLYKIENELKQKLDKDLRSVVHQSSLGGHYETTRIMIESVDKALSDPDSDLDKNQLSSFKGDLHFTLQEFNQAAKSYEGLNTELHKIASDYAKIKSDDQALLTNHQLGDLLERFISFQDKHVAYQTFYYHVLRSTDDSPQSYLKAVKNILDLLNNVAHWTYEGFDLESDQSGHLSLRGAPYQMYILPIATEKPFNALSPLKVNSLDLRNSRTDDLERLLGLKLDTIDIRWTKVRFEKFRLLQDRVDLKKIIIIPGQFDAKDLKQMRKNIIVEERKAPDKK